MYQTMTCLRPHRAAIVGLLTLSWALLLAACVATPIPEPPNVTEPELDLVEAVPDSEIRGDMLIVTGRAGAATAEATLWAVNLDSPTDELWAPVSAPISEDGSFNLSLDGEPGDELRLQVRWRDDWSEPVDALTGAGGGLSPSVREDCLVVDVELPFGRVALEDAPTAALTVRNNCAANVEVTDIGWRFEPAPFELLTTAPLVVGAGESQMIEVAFDPDRPGLLEAILFVDVFGSEPSFDERRPVTVYGYGVGE